MNNCIEQTSVRRAGLFLIILLLVLNGAWLFGFDISKRGDASRGGVSRVDVAGLDFGRSSRLVTAMRDSDDKLRLIVWQVSSSGQLSAKGNLATEGTIKEVAIVSVGGNRVVTVLRDSRDRLRLIAWDISSDGRTITRRGTRTGVSIRSLAAAGQTGGTNPQAFVAARTTAGNLHVGHWPVNASGNILEPKVDTFGEADELAASGGVSNVAAMKDSDGELRLIHFWSPLFRGGAGTGGRISKVAVADLGGGGFAGNWMSASASPGPTAVRTGALGGGRLLIGAGTLKVITWEVEDTGLKSNLKRKGEAELSGHAGIAFEIEALPLHGHNTFVTAHQGVGTYRKALARDRGKPELRLIAWRPRSSGDIDRIAEKTLSGTFTQIAMTQIQRGDVRSRFVTAMRDGSGNLRVFAWDFD